MKYLEMFENGMAVNRSGWIIDKNGEELGETPEGAIVDEDGYFVRYERDSDED
jgi:hypothetical protein